jgi:hypothetical protein
MPKSVKNLILVVTSCIAIIALGEFVASRFVENSLLAKAVSDWRNKHPDLVSCFRLSDELGIEPIPGQCGFPDLSTYAGNSGDRVLGAESEGGRYRILILGDSNTSRAEVDKILGEKLNVSVEEGGESFEVFKVGVESYNTRQEYLLLEKEAINLNPDMVILQFTLNDFDFSPVVLRQGDKIVFFTSRGERGPETNSFLFKYSSLYRIYSLNKLLIQEKNISEEELYGSFWEERVQAMEGNLDLYNKLLQEKGISSVVIIYPIFGKNQWLKEREAILGLLRKKDMDFIDLLPITEPYGGPSYFQGKDGVGNPDLLHPKREFDEIVAEALKGYILNWAAAKDSQ